MAALPDIDVNVYKFNSKEEDAAFLAGSSMTVDVAMTTSEFDRHPLSKGSPLVVQLSSGKKYKAIVEAFEILTLGRKLKGKISLRRVN